MHSADDPVVLTGLAVGTHRLSLILGDGTHGRLGPTVAETTVTVEGPSIDASTPATSPAGEPVVLTVKVEGLTLVKADGDTSGDHRPPPHLHRPRPDAGRPAHPCRGRASSTPPRPPSPSPTSPPGPTPSGSSPATASTPPSPIG